MVIGILELDLFIPEANSLKFKRRVVKSLKEKIRRKFNVSVAEAGNLDKWQRQSLAVAGVNTSKRLLNSILSKIVNLAEAEKAVQVLDYNIQMF